MNKLFLNRLRGIFDMERTVSRLIAAWASYTAWILLCSDESFANLAYAQGSNLWGMAGAVLLIFVFYSLAAFALVDFSTDSWFLLGAATVCAFRWLRLYEGDGTSKFLFALALTATYALFVLYFVHSNSELLSDFYPTRGGLMTLAILLALIAGAVVAAVTCLRYLCFASPNFDFGIFCNMFHRMKEDGLAVTTCERDTLLSHFAVHVSPVYYLLLPVYWIFPSPLTLQIGQAVLLMAGVIPIVLLGRHFKLSHGAILTVAALYCFYPVISTGCFFDFHENCFLPLFLLFTFYFFETRRDIPMYCFALLTLSVKEDAAIYLLIFALWAMLSRRRYLHGGVLALLSVAYFVVASWYLTEYGTGVMVNRFDNLILNEKEGLLGAIRTALVNPGYLLTQLFGTTKGGWEKLQYLLYLFLPLGFLPLCTKRASRWLLVLPVLFNLLTDYVYQYDIGFQYHFGITAFLFYAALGNLPQLKPSVQRTLLALSLAAGFCLYSSSVLPRLESYSERWEEDREKFAQMEEFLDTLPKDSSVAASTFLLPHLADRDEIYEVAYHDGKTDVDYVVLDLRYVSHTEFYEHYTAQGYVVWGELEDLIVVLVSPSIP